MKVFLRSLPTTSGLRNSFESRTKHVIGESHEHEAVAKRGASFTQLHAHWPRKYESYETAIEQAR